jgi:phosphotransferase system  glucose/maltose/N-acetylglucosamine-specific IIC component
VDNSELQARDVLIAIGTTLIVWAISTFILWRFINEWVDRRYLEEVVQ